MCCNVSFTSLVCLAGEMSLCCSLVWYDTPLDYCIASLVPAQAFIDMTQTLPLVRPPLLLMLLIKTCSMTKPVDSPSPNLSLLLTYDNPAETFRTHLKVFQED